MDNFDKEVMDSLVQNEKSEKKWKDAEISDYGKTWKFKEDKVIEGKFIRASEVQTPYGLKRVFAVKAPNGEVYSIWEKARIVKFFDSIQIGSDIKITYLGMGQTSKGQPVNNFKFQVAE
jgi:hypothetical protein